MENKYYTPNFNEFIPGFKCQSCFWYFTHTDEEEWVDVEFTEELLNKVIGLIKADAYETEFRAIK